jgi:hypothetical protein
MIEEFLTRRIEKLQEQNAKIQDDAEKSFDEIDEKKDKYVTVSSSYTYQESEDALNTQERFHYATFLAVAIAAQAVESKLLKTKYARRMIRRFLLSDNGKHIRSLLYRKGSAGTSQGLLRSSTPGSPGLVKSILKHRMQKDQIRSTGISIKQAGMAAGDFVSEGLEKLISMSLFIEENSPMKMMRTMSASQVLQSIKMRKDMPSYHISRQDMTEMGTYYHQMIDKYGKGRSLNQYDSNLGLFYDNGRILGAKMENGKVVANQADILAHGVIPAFTQTDVSGTGLDVNTNQIFRKYLIEQGVSTAVLDSYNNLPGTKKVSFVFGNNTADAAKNYAAGYMSKMFESGSRAMDSPFAAIVEPIEEKIRATKDPKSKKLFKTLYNTFTPRFGSGTLSANADKLLYDRPLKEQAKTLLKNVIAKPITITAGVLTANQLIGSTFGDEYRLEQLGGDIIANTQLLYAKIFSDGFLQDIKQKQEEVIPNSTGFQPILGVVGSLGMMGATVSYFKGLHEKSTLGLAVAEAKSAASKLNIDPLVNTLNNHLGAGAGQVANSLLDGAKALPFVGGFLSKDHHRSTRWAIAGAAIGAALSLPLLPGAIAGETSEELQKQFSGEKKVAVKANSGWIFGGEDYEGGKTKYFDRHWYAKLKANVSTKVYYGDESTKDELNPITNPFGYLADPYKMEKMHEKDMPYPVWGMDVTYGGFIGEVFEGTVGRLIKPTIVNENLKQYLASDNGEGEFRLKKKVTQEEADLIKEGKLLLPIAPENSPTTDALKKATIGALDFSGFKGFMAQTVVSKTGYTDPLLTNSSLERSGSMVTLAKSIKESNLGDMMGLGEAQRRIINTGADSLAGRKENPLRNLMPSWMPGDESGFYIDFQHGNAFAKVENAESRLPGVGYAEFNPTLKGMDAEKYPLINRYEILSDVALGSKEYYNTKREIENKQKRGELTKYESNKISRIEEETTARMKTKNFSDDITIDNPTSKLGVLGSIAKTYWEGLTAVAQGPHETLTPVRFGSKFIHDRTATEDYKKNMIFGNDMALWTRPVDHFLAASAHETLAALEDETSIPESVDRQRAIDQYFDRLEFYKQRQLYKKARDEGDTSSQREIKAKMEGTKIGAEATKLNSRQDLFAAYRSMSNREKEYFQNFAQTTDQDKQEEILGMVSQDEAKIYRSIWENNERMEDIDSEEEMKAFITDDTQEYEKNMDKAEVESVEFMSSTLGMPDVDFSGWDPRIEIKDVKLRFLQLAREEIRDYGYWANDELEMLRKVAILRDNNFMNKRDDIDSLTAKYRNREESEFNIREHLQKQNIKAKNVEVRDGNGSFDIIQQG